jgi:nicotinamidase-related amidase
MSGHYPASKTALLLVDLQNDFLHAEGAYARGGCANAQIAALPARLMPLLTAMRKRSSLTMGTLFTLVPGRDGEPIISPHLKQLRPFLRRGDFAPGSWGQQIVDELLPIDVTVEKVAYSAFYMTRLEWVLRKLDIDHLIVGGIVTNGGVASTIRDAHVRDIHVSVLSDGCAAFSPQTHQEALDGLKPIADIKTIAQVLTEL